jgi:RND family efflux transporter MFP subunit
MSAPDTEGASQLRSLRRFALGVLLIAVVVAGWGIFSRLQARDALRTAAAEAAVPVVAVVHPQRNDRGDALVLPGNVQAYSDAPIYARTNGYLKRWYVDIGAHVKAGQLLAEIDTPDVDAQLRQARADLATAQANSNLANVTAERWQKLLASGTVAKQDVDEKIGDAEAKRAAVDSARENVARLDEMEGFRRVVAPFDGVITARHTDIGALISNGTGTGTGQELFHLVDTERLRIYVQVPQTYVPYVHVGSQAELSPLAQPQLKYAATVTSTARAIDTTTRTLLTELSVSRAEGLLPGAYAEIRLPIPASAAALQLPSSTLLFRPEGTVVATVAANNHVVLKVVQLGRDLGAQVEILAGLAEADRVVLNPSDSLAADTVVRVSAPGT